MIEAKPKGRSNAGNKWGKKWRNVGELKSGKLREGGRERVCVCVCVCVFCVCASADRNGSGWARKMKRKGDGACTVRWKKERNHALYLVSMRVRGCSVQCRNMVTVMVFVRRFLYVVTNFFMFLKRNGFCCLSNADEEEWVFFVHFVRTIF